MTTYHCGTAWLPPGRVARDVEVVVDGDRIVSVTEGAQPAADVARLGGLVLPGLANAHSHAFHRALRGRTHGGHGTFWTWREQMYAVAGRLDPDGYLALARATFAEMALAGVTCVGEFHYLHHTATGRPYDDPNTMGHVLVQAARDAGLRIALLDACYLTGGLGRPLEGVQLRFGDGDAERWADRASELHTSYGQDDDVVVGAALHSARAVPRDQMAAVAAWSHHHGAPLHAHVSEQRAENEACAEAYGVTPTRLLHEHGVLGPRTSAVHATHVTDEDIALLGGSQTFACICPTTERDLADGIGPARRLHEAGSAITLGSDSHAVVDLLEEARAVELHERLATETRGHWTAGELLGAATGNGHASLGFPAAGSITAGALADLVAVRLDSVRTAGAGPDAAATVIFAATAADVTDVVSSGRRVVAEGRHVLVPDVAGSLTAGVGAVVPT
ncbi:MAG: formimidoylglutamate deiminase [Actinomycetes bacterium]